MPTATTDPTPPAGPSQDERLWAILAHLCIFIGIACIIGPLLIWLLHPKFLRSPSTFVEHHAKQATIYQLAITLITMLTCFLALPLWLVFIIFPILAALEAHNGRLYSYPLMESVRPERHP